MIWAPEACSRYGVEGSERGVRRSAEGNEADGEGDADFLVVAGRHPIGQYVYGDVSLQKV